MTPPLAGVGAECGPTVLLTWEAAAVIAGALLGVRGLRQRATTATEADAEG